MKIKKVFSIFLLCCLAFLFFTGNKAYAASVTNYYDSVPPGFVRVDDSFCSGGLAQCWNSWAVGATDCGTVCNGGAEWSKYEFEGCYKDPFLPDEYGNLLENTSAACSTGDKYNSDNPPVLNAGKCSAIANSCDVGGAYKTCCNGTTPVNASIITTSPPNDFLDPSEAGCGGFTTVRCGGPGEPACGQAACNTLAPAVTSTPTSTPATTNTPTPTSTPAPRVDSATLACTGSAPTLDASWTGNTLNNCNVYIRAGTSDQQISTACNGSQSLNTLPNGTDVVPGGTYELHASDGINDRVSQATCPTGPTPPPCSAPTSLTGECSSTGTTLTFKWNGNSCATKYAVRIDGKSTTVNPDIVDNNAPCNADASGKCTYSRGTISEAGPTYEAWVHAINAAGQYSDASNHVTVDCSGPPTTSTPTPTITPTPTDRPDSMNPILSQQCVVGSPGRETISLRWKTISGGTFYDPDLKNASGGPVGGIPGSFQPPPASPVGTVMSYQFPDNYPDVTTNTRYTGWVHAKNARGSTFKSESDQRNAINCVNPTPTLSPTPAGGGGGTSPTECEPRPQYFCTASNSTPSQCESTPQSNVEAKHQYCQGITGFGGSICVYCPPLTVPPPPPIECLHEGGLLQMTPIISDNCQETLYKGEPYPACRDAGGNVRYLRIRVDDPSFSGGDGGDTDDDSNNADSFNILKEKDLAKSPVGKIVNIVETIGKTVYDSITKVVYAVQSGTTGYSAHIYRTDKFGFIDAGIQKTLEGEQPHGQGTFYDDRVKERVTYYQAQSYNAAGAVNGPTSGQWVAPEKDDDDWGDCERGGGGAFGAPSWTISNVTATSITSTSFLLRWNVTTSFISGGSHPSYYIIRKNGLDGFVPSTAVTGSFFADNPFCSFCGYHATVSYTITNLKPGTTYQFGIGTMDYPNCPSFNDPTSNNTISAATLTGSAPTVKPGAPSNVSAAVNTRGYVTTLSFTPPTAPGNIEEGTRLYSTQDERWPKDTRLPTEYYNDTDTSVTGPMGSGTYFFAQESIDNLDPGFYYYGLNGSGAYCSPGIQTNQARYEVKGFSLSGKVFFDENANGVFEPSPGGSDSCFTGTVRFSVDDTGRGTSKSRDVDVENCDYSFSVKQGTYNVTFAPPFGFRITNTADTPFNVVLPPDSTNHNFGIYAPPWFQTREGDVRSAGKLVNEMPDKTPKLYTSLDGANTPGIIFYGGASNNINLGSGLPSSQEWLVNETFISSTDLSYESFESRALSAGGSINPYRCGVQGCINPPAQNGVFRYVVEEGRETMVVAQPWKIDGGKRVIVLVPGNLRIQGSLNEEDPTVTNKQIIKVDKGSFLAFIVKGNIIIDPAIGYGGSASNLQKTDSNLDGFFIADGSFIPGTFETSGTDNRLNIEGMTMVGTKTDSELRLNRHLGSVNNTNYPSVYVNYRLDMVMNAHPALLRPFFHWEEIAP